MFCHAVKTYNGWLFTKSEDIKGSILKVDCIIQSEVSQEEKNKYHTLIYIYGI